MGEVFAGRYELLDPIATGGMGSIWRTLDRQDGQVKVAKILRQSDAASLLRFVREQSVRIDHTHVVTPLSWAGMDDRVLFTMPLVRGGSVADLVKEQGGLPLRWVALLTDQLLQALEAVHGAGIVHRDVKPGNLLLEPTGVGTVPHLRLTDFGIAAPLDGPRMTRASVAIGTPGYMPPEQWFGADPDPRADLYAVGRVALEMLTGRRAAGVAADEPPPESDGDPHRDALLRLVEHATASAVEDRPADAATMRDALAVSGLLDLPRPPDERVGVPDRFADLLAPAAAPPPPPPPPPGPPGPPGTSGLATAFPGPGTLPLPPPTLAATRADLSHRAGSPVPAGPAGSRAPALALVALGLVGLVVAALLVLTA
jgi:eukaryotic-like serine/threonine-protein kinase